MRITADGGGGGAAAGPGANCEDVSVSETGKPGRYTRSTNGLVAALVVTVLAVLAFVVWRAAFRQELEVRPEPYDYLAAVEGAQAAGVDVVYPGDLPEGWMATRVLLRQGERPEWGISLLTDEERFVGVRQREDSVEDLVEELPVRHRDEELLRGIGHET